MMNSEQRLQYIQTIEALPGRLRKAMEGLTEDQLNTPHREGGWNIRQVVHHLTDAHLNAFVRMKLMLTEERPMLKTYEQDAWAALPDSRSAPVEVSLQVLEGLHARWVLLMKNLSREEWQKVGLHPEAGELSLQSLLNLCADHCRNHLSQILRCRRDNGWL